MLFKFKSHLTRLKFFLSLIDIAILLNPADYSIDFANKCALLVGVVGLGWGEKGRPMYTGNNTFTATLRENGHTN